MLPTSRHCPPRYTVEVRAPGNMRESATTNRSKETTRIDALISIIAVGACLIALTACAVGHYLSASV